MIALNKYIVIEKIVEEAKTESGLIMSAEDKNDMRYNKGIVLVSGTEVHNIKEGDEIYYDKMAGHQARIKDKVYTIIREVDVVVCFPR